MAARMPPIRMAPSVSFNIVAVKGSSERPVEAIVREVSESQTRTEQKRDVNDRYKCATHYDVRQPHRSCVRLLDAGKVLRSPK